MEDDNKWRVDLEIPSLEGETDTPVDMEYVDRIWKTNLEKYPRSMRRFRFCVGCVHLKQVSGYMLSCSYILHTGQKRPCRFGSECSVKEVPEGYRYPPGYEEWLHTAEKARDLPSGPGKRGREAQWDTEYGKRLYDSGFSVSEICRIMGLSRHTLSGYMHQHLWNYDENGDKRRKNFPHATEETIEAERIAYLRHLAEREGE